MKVKLQIDCWFHLSPLTLANTYTVQASLLQYYHHHHHLLTPTLGNKLCSPSPAAATPCSWQHCDILKLFRWELFTVIQSAKKRARAESEIWDKFEQGHGGLCGGGWKGEADKGSTHCLFLLFPGQINQRGGSGGECYRRQWHEADITRDLVACNKRELELWRTNAVGREFNTSPLVTRTLLHRSFSACWGFQSCVRGVFFVLLLPRFSLHKDDSLVRFIHPARIFQST